jgi:DHA1 family bicyclomycin/chloramphenicol resistance-like MFS transporter
MFAYIFGSPFVFMQIHGVRPDHYGWLFGWNALGLIAACGLSALAVHRHNSALRGAETGRAAVKKRGEARL